MPKPVPTVAFLTESEIERLDEFFMREGGPEDTMDAAMLDGYLAAVVSGPRLIMPGEMLRWVWDTERGEAQPEFQSNEEAQDIIGLIMRQWNAVNDALTHSPQSYEPLINERQIEGGTIPIIDEWCMGYYKGISLDLAGWSPLLVSQPALFSSILLYGTDEGWEQLKRKKLSTEEHVAIADSLGESARAIHAFWLEQRRQQAADGRMPAPVYRRESVRREGPKIGRNDPCPCGSGKKYKHCHGNN